MGNQSSIEFENIKKINSMSIGFNEKAFLLVFNADQDGENGEAYAIPVNFVEKVVKGLIDCGQEYQKLYGKNIGFDTVEHLEEKP